MQLQQEQFFHKLDSDIQFLVKQLGQGVTEGFDLVKREHATTRDAFTQETARAEIAINAHTDTQMLDLKTTTETNEQCGAFLKSLKAERMNERYTYVMDSSEASFNQVFATYQEMMAMYCENSDDGDDESEGDDHYGQDSDGEYGWEDEDDVGDDSDSNGYESSERSSVLSNTSDVLDIWSSWDSFISWLRSDETLFYIEGKPGSGKSTLVKYILDHDRTRDLIQEWNPDAIIIRHFFWKIGSKEQNSIKGLWCSLLYQRLEGQPALIQGILLHFPRLSLHTSCYDWTTKELQAVWEYTTDHDRRYLCIFIDGLDEIRIEDGLSQGIQSILQLLKFPRTKVCVATRPEAQIMRWLQETTASGFRLQDLTEHDMVVFVRNEFRPLLSNKSDLFRRLNEELVDKAQGVFLWLHLATRSLIEGIENHDPEDMLLRRLDELPKDLETLYLDMWQRLNANNSVYRQMAARYFRYVLLSSTDPLFFEFKWFGYDKMLPFIFQIACAEDLRFQETLLAGDYTIETSEILRMCEEAEASMRTRCAGLLEFHDPSTGDHNDTFMKGFVEVGFIHRTAHDFLKDTEAGRRIVGHEASSDPSLQFRLLKGLICTMIVSSSNWGLEWELGSVIDTITEFGKHWGSSNLGMVLEILDVMRPLYDKARIKTTEEVDDYNYRRPFLSFLTHSDCFDDFVISCVTAARSVAMASDILRDGWSPFSHKILSKRLFDALVALGADPHSPGLRFEETMPGPFVSRATAFTNFLVSFCCLKESFDISSYEELTLEGCNLPFSQDQSEIIGMATHMAKSCRNMNTSVALVGCPFQNEILGMKPLLLLPDILHRPKVYGNHVIIYEINLQFLLLYLLSRAGGDSVETVLGNLGAKDLLLRLNSPWIKMRYLVHSETRRATATGRPRVVCHRVAPQASDLPNLLIHYLLDSTVHRSAGGHWLKVELCRQSDGMSVSYGTRTDISDVVHGVKDSEIEEVDFETMMTCLADEAPDISTYEEAGIVPSVAYLNSYPPPDWYWFPLMMKRLRAAAISKEERIDREERPL